MFCYKAHRLIGQEEWVRKRYEIQKHTHATLELLVHSTFTEMCVFTSIHLSNLHTCEYTHFCERAVVNTPTALLCICEYTFICEENILNILKHHLELN